MCLHCHPLRAGPVVALTTFLAALTSSASAGDVLRVYGPSSLEPALQEAATAFEQQNKVGVEVTAGPEETWLDRAAADADLIYASADFMMNSLIKQERLGLDPDSVTPLYLRPSAILVRPGNPKHVTDFPDLLQPGMRVMVVSGSGQVGLWEDMAGGLGDVRAIRTLRKNIVFVASNSDEALQTWKTQADIDAWITWNIWHAPLRSQAALVHVSQPYRIHRQCSIALTNRGKQRPAAMQFVDFLISPEGTAIFESWGWAVQSDNQPPLAIRRDVAAACRITTDERKDGVGAGLAAVRRLIQDYAAIGIAATEVHLCVVVEGNAGYWLLRDEAYRAKSGTALGNPNKALVQELLDLGVRLELCGRTMADNGWTEADLLPGVEVVPSANIRVIDLQLQGYAYIRF